MTKHEDEALPAAVGSPADGGVGRLPHEATNACGPRGTYGCACVSRSGHACAELRYGYREIPEPCECLCHDWRDDDDDLG
jgi:hypothetical protein